MKYNWFTGLPRWLSGKESACQCRRRRFHPWVGKIPWRRKWWPAPVFWSGKSHGQKSLATVHRGHKRVRHNLVTKQQEIDLQCHVSFRCSAKWFNYVCVCVCIYIYTYIYIYIFIYICSFRFFSHIGYYKILWSTLCYTVGPCCLLVLYIVVCVFI